MKTCYTMFTLIVLAILQGCGGQPPTQELGDSDQSQLVAGTKLRCEKSQLYNGYTFRFRMSKVKNLAGDVFMTCEVSNYSAGYTGSSVTPSMDASDAECRVSYMMQNSGPYDTTVFSTWTFRQNGEVAYEQSNYPAFDGTQFTFNSTFDCQ
mgnify:CR=1 FL=1